MSLLRLTTTLPIMSTSLIGVQESFIAISAKVLVDFEVHGSVMALVVMESAGSPKQATTQATCDRIRRVP